MTGEDLPKARVRRRRLPSIAWLVPLVALLVAGYLLWDRLRERGPEIVISFADGAGVRVGAVELRRQHRSRLGANHVSRDNP